MSERLCGGLQTRLGRFDSYYPLQVLFMCVRLPYVSSESTKALVAVLEARNRLALSGLGPQLGHCVAVDKLIYGQLAERICAGLQTRYRVVKLHHWPPTFADAGNAIVSTPTQYVVH